MSVSTPVNGLLTKHIGLIVTMTISFLTTLVINAFWLGAYHYRLTTTLSIVDTMQNESKAHVQDSRRHIDPERDRRKEEQLLENIRDLRIEIRAIDEKLNQIITREGMRYRK